MKGLVLIALAGIELLQSPSAWGRPGAEARVIDCVSKKYEIKLSVKASIEHGVVIESGSLRIDGKAVKGLSLDSNGSLDVNYRADGSVDSKALFYPSTFGIMATGAQTQLILDVDSEVPAKERKGKLLVIPFIGLPRSSTTVSCSVTDVKESDEPTSR